jgi:hypothetical protein
MRVWRQSIKSQWGHEFDFIDPVDQIISQGKAQEAVEADIKAIESSDAVIANMWKESIGTAIGVFITRKKARQVVVIDRNHIRNKMLAYWANAVVNTEYDAIQYLLDWFKSQDKIVTIIKKSGKAEKFDCEKLADSIQAASRAAGHEDILASAEILPLVLNKLVTKRTTGQDEINSSVIKGVVWEVLGELETDPDRYKNFEGIRKAWEEYDLVKRGKSLPVIQEVDECVTIYEMPRPVPFLVGSKRKKSHALLWGKMKIECLNDLPSSAKPVFFEICCVEGISDIQFRGYGRGRYDGRCLVELSPDKSSKKIKGSVYDKGKECERQDFEITVQDSSKRDLILTALFHHLNDQGMIRSRG